MEMGRALGEGDGDESLSGSDKDESLDEDMEALKRACMLTGTNPNEIEEVSAAHAAASDSEGNDSGTDDVEVFRSLQQRFSAPLEDGKPLVLKPLSTRPPLSGSDDEEDFETLRAIERRFAKYNIDALKKMESTNVHNPNTTSEQETHNILLANDTTGEALDNEFRDYEDACSAYEHLGSVGDGDLRSQPLGSIESHRPVAPVLSSITPKYSSFPASGEVFIDAIKKNRSCQRFIRSKLIEIEARIEENKKLLERMKVLKDFQSSCKRRAGRALSQKKDVRLQLISVPKLRNSQDIKANCKKVSALSYGPVENSHVQFYRAVLTTLFPLSLHRQPWSQVEKENLAKGIKQQIQEMLFDKSLVLYSGSEGSSAASDAVDSIIASITDLEFSPEILRSFFPKIDWLRLASMHFMGRSGAECEARWLNIEDPLINQNAWTKCEDKKLLHLLQEKGTPYNWIDIASRLETNRTPFQCLARYQRSLNIHIMKRDWTPEEDAQLCVAVEVFGEGHWQLIASNLEGRTGTQCSNRWRKTLHPSRKVVGRWTVDEDKRLKVAVMLLGPKSWPRIAKFVHGRTQVQCRERWVNALDPSLNLGEWTEDEDNKLEAAIKEHGYCWSKVAAAVPPRTDSQCRRRWKVLFPHEVPLLQAARKIQKAALISNFVDRESERPELGAGDFLALPGTDSIPDLENGNNNGKGRKRSSDTPKSRAKRSRTKAQIYPEEALSPTNCDDAETVGSDDTSSKKQKTPSLPLKMKKSVKSVQISIPDSENGNSKGEEKERSSDSPKSMPKRSRTKAQKYTEEASSPTSCDDDETIGSYMSSMKSKTPKLPSKRKKSDKSVLDHQDHSSISGDSSRLKAMNCEIEAIGGNDATKEKKTLKSFSRSNERTKPARDHHSVSLSAEDFMTLTIRNADDAGTSGVDYANSKEKNAVKACPNKRKYTKPIQDGHNLSGSNAGTTGMEDYNPKIKNPTTGDAGRMYLTYFRKKKKNQAQLDRGQVQPACRFSPS
ncbi:snRNA-activating protein complex subunit 4 isoform X2 [Macadamia integrifolia]|uniref:snRNA-activating protein complex subunit 4 isoform X2 n=1 Tax=Macadamia integrifolia TaxID=60698 RepID=UPI001C4E4420|nr:snRNA-activating protein complex subunit 4 isoform X2 [Macadamia integrifolia]